MKRLILSAAVAAIAIVATAPSARAQLPGFQIGASGGIAFPLSDLGNAANTGYNVAVAVGVKPYASPIGIRLEAAYNEFGLQGGGNVNIPAFTANATLALPAAGFTPYVIGGAGLYRPSAALTGIGNGNAENDFGFNIGGGIKIPLSSSFETFVEARYNRVNNVGGPNGGSVSFVPLTVGIMW